MSSDAVPVIAAMDAPALWQRIELLSDLHLSESTPRTTAAFLAYLRDSTADAILLLGDVLEVWVGDDVLGQDGFERSLFDAIAAAAGHRWIGLMHGNRDFMVGPDALASAGLHALSDPLCLRAWGHSWLLTHGDALCIGDTDYQAFRRQVRSPQWQAGMLALPLAQRLETGRRMREASEARKRSHTPESYADIDLATSLAWLQHAGTQQLIHGHTHRPGSEPWGPGERHVLSDWDLDGDVPRADMLVLTPAGLSRQNIPAPD